MESQTDLWGPHIGKEKNENHVIILILYDYLTWEKLQNKATGHIPMPCWVRPCHVGRDVSQECFVQEAFEDKAVVSIAVM